MERFKIDFNVFKDATTVQCNQNGSDALHRCISLKRLLCALKYYTLLRVSGNTDGHNIFTAFICDIYTNVLNDYTHLVNEYHNLEAITDTVITSKMFTVCDVNNCNFTARHYSDNTRRTKQSMNEIAKFYTKIMDSLHFYIFHLFDSGQRTKRQMLQLQNNDDPYFDKELSAITKVTQQKQKQLSFKRLTNNSRFNLYIQPQSKPTQASITCIDQLFAYLSSALHNMHIAHHIIAKLQMFIESQEYDTDAIMSDIEHYSQSNIASHMNDKRLIIVAAAFMKTITLRCYSFNVGLIFYYWAHYKNMKLFDDNNNKYNINDHSGYNVCDLYLPQKHSTFKEEIMEYPSICLAQYEDTMIKITKYLSTLYVKSMQANNKGIKLKYDIQNGAILLPRHILSVCLYTDSSALSADFAATFYAKYPLESLYSIKTRNSCYWWMAKSLREAVELYGVSKQDTKQTFVGPFYCRCVSSHVVTFPSFEMRLCAPTSTTYNIEIAMMTLKESFDGVVVQLNNTVEFGHRYLRGFKCGWISNYKHENEVIFMGGHNLMKLESIQIFQTKNNGYCRNYSLFCSAFSKFNAMFDGGYVHQNDMNSSEKQLISKLMNLKMNRKNATHNVDKYVVESFDAFCRNKQYVVFNLYLLASRYQDKALRDIIFYELKHGALNTLKCKTNIFRKVLFEIFPNLEHIEIYTTMDIGGASTRCELSFAALLSEIESLSVKKIMVKAVSEYRRDKKKKGSWIYFQWRKSSKQLQQKYMQKRYQIVLKNTKNLLKKDEDCVVIQTI